MTKQFVGGALCFLVSTYISAQPVSGRLKFEKGITYNIQMVIHTSVAQQAMGQAVDFKADATCLHAYKTTDANKDVSSLHHFIEKISFDFDGMGQKRSFDSDSTRDLQGMFGPAIKEILSKKFDITVDPNGKTLAVTPEKLDSVKTDERLAIVFAMLKDVTAVVYPPKKGEASFFKILPDKPVQTGDTWNESGKNENGKFNNDYTVSDINDSLITVDFKGQSNTVTKNTMMGMETSTTLNSTSAGKILIDRSTGIIREKSVVTESNGTTEAMGGTLPVTSKTTIQIVVNPTR